jgi:chloride channel protein, CIC family
MEMESKQTNNRIKARLNTLLNNLHYWRLKYIGSRNFLIIASIIVGIVSALAAVVLKKGVHYLQYLTGVIADYQSIKFVYIVLPLCGIVATFLIIKYIFKKPFEKGLGSIIYDISWNSGNIKAHKTFSHILTSGITVGLGGSAGLEAPIAVTGSAIGSNIAKLFRLGYNERVVLLACGATAGIAAVFNSPIAGVIFAIEVLLTNFSIPVFIPLLISAATSAIVSNLIYEGQLFYLVTDKWHYNAIPFYIVLGIITGLFSVYITRVTLFVEGKLNKKNTLLKPIIGGLVLGGLIFIFPPLWGEGYKTIELLLSSADKGTLLDNSLFMGFSGNGKVVLIFIAAIIFIKSFATSLTIGSGGNGGILAPSLFTGALIGFSLAFFINGTGIMHLSTVNFIAVGMAGILSGVVRAPLTAIFLIAEVTGGYVLFVPLMIVSALSYFIARYFEPYSIYTKRLAQKGQLMTDDKDMNTLSLLKMQDVIEKDFIILKPTDTLDRFVSVFQESNRNLFPVVDRYNVFYGMVHLEKAKSYLFKTELYKNMKIADIMDTEIDTVSLNDNMLVVMEQFDKAKSWNIVVVDGNKYIGIVSKSNLIHHYRRIIKRSTNLF